MPPQQLGERRGSAMKALLIAAHGSPYGSANEEITRVAEVIAARAIFDLVEVCYLDLNDPSIPDAIDAAIARGASAIVLVPYFLHTGRHTLIDIPEIIDAARERHPSTDIRLADYLGHQREQLVALLAHRATENR